VHAVDLSVEFSAALAQLADDERLVDADIGRLLVSLAADARATIDSLTGVMVVLMVEGHPIMLTAFDGEMDEARVTTSVVLPLPALAKVEPGSMLILYASRPGAFVDFAADAALALGIAPDSVTLDRHLPAPGQLGAHSGLHDVVLINRAIGVLLGRGLHPDAARVEMQRRAWMSGTTLGEAASALIASLEHRSPLPQ
jgi:hypothetical protein